MAHPRHRLAVGQAGLRQSDLAILVDVATIIPDGVLRVVEDDTYHVLSAEAEFRPAVDHPIRVLTAAWNAEPTPPGSVIIRQDASPEILAVVYDLDASPPTCEEWVLRCLANILDAAEKRQTPALALPVLGGRFRVLTEEDFGRLLATAIARQPVRHLLRIVVPGDHSLVDGIKLGVEGVEHRV